MKTRLALCVLLFGLSTVFVSSGTVAFFSDVEEATVRVSSGVVNVTVDGQDRWSRSYHLRQRPGDTHTSPEDRGILEYPVENVGDTPLDVWQRVTNVEPYGQLDAADVEYSLRADNRWLIRSGRGMPVADIADRWIYIGRLAPRQSVRIDQAFRVQGGRRDFEPSGGFEFDSQVLALQTSGAPNPVPELPGFGR
ncbi:MAG: hypothetical protein HY876_04155 [Coriobacteriales bacterium]|nr:hypothetical protein [Coriobacteriales bacterium]